MSGGDGVFQGSVMLGRIESRVLDQLSGALMVRGPAVELPTAPQPYKGKKGKAG